MALEHLGVSKRFRILATLKQGNKSMYSNTSGYVHMGLRLDWGKSITGQETPVPTHIPIPGPTLSVAGGGGGSNTTHALLSPDPETLPMGGVSRPATGEFPGAKMLQGQPTVAPHAPLTAGPNSSLSQRYGPAIIP